VEDTVREEKVSIARACKILDFDRSMFYYEPRKDDSQVENKLREYSVNLPNRGFPEYFKRIRREGIVWNHKRVRRVYKKLGMAKRKKVKRRIPNPKKQPLLQPIRMNLTWSMDFMQDTLENGRKFRVLNIIDDFNRESLTINISYSFPSEKVIEILEEVIEWRGKPESIRTDNGTEFIAHAFTNYCIRKNIEHIKIQKGKPTQNSYIERFNRSYREDVLDAYIFEDLNQVRIATELFMEDYNNEHPHESLGDKSPIEFLNAVNCGKLNAQSIHTSLPQLTAL